MPLVLDQLPEAYLAFLAERHLGTLTTLRADGSPHVVPVGFIFDPLECVVRIITNRGSRKVANVRATARAVVCQVDGPRWATLEGTAKVREDPGSVRRGVEAYATRYRMPGENPQRVVIELGVERALGRG
jgi:PPOX class probable F420-dependent enzyme